MTQHSHSLALVFLEAVAQHELLVQAHAHAGRDDLESVRKSLVFFVSLQRDATCESQHTAVITLPGQTPVPVNMIVLNSLSESNPNILLNLMNYM